MRERIATIDNWGQVVSKLQKKAMFFMSSKNIQNRNR